MRGPRGLAARVLLVSLLGVLLGGPLMFFSVVYVVADMAIDRSLEQTEASREQRVADCLADPAGWSLTTGIDRGYAYEAASASSANPDAPPLEPGLLEELEASEASHVSALEFPPTHGVILARFGPRGPCELLGVHYESPRANRRRGAAALWLTLVLVLAIAGALAIFVAIRPTLARIEALADNAEAIGDAERFAPLDDPAGDALARLAARVADSHTRIVTTNAILSERASALEEHLEDVAHDIRTPLAALQLRLEQLRGDLGGAEGEQLSAAIGEVVYLTQLTANFAPGQPPAARPARQRAHP